MRAFVGRHPLASFLVAAYAIFWASWMPVLFLDAPPRLFSSLGAILGLVLPAFLVTAVTDGTAGVRDLLWRTLRGRGANQCVTSTNAGTTSSVRR